MGDPVDLGTHQVTGPALAPVCELGHPLAILDGSHLDPQAETAHCAPDPVIGLAGGREAAWLRSEAGRAAVLAADDKLRQLDPDGDWPIGLEYLGQVVYAACTAADPDHDAGVLAWARGKVLEVTGRWRGMAARMAGSDLEANAEKWRLIAVAVENALVGGKTGDLAAFDERHAR